MHREELGTAWDWVFPSSMWNANLYAWEPHIDYERGNGAAPPARSPTSLLLPTILPVAHWPFPSPLGDTNGACLCRWEVPAAHQGSAALSNCRGRAKPERICPRFPTVHLHADPKSCQQHKLLTPRGPLTAEGLLEGWEPFLKLKDFLNRSSKVRARHNLKNMETLLLWKYQQLT